MASRPGGGDHEGAQALAEGLVVHPDRRGLHDRLVAREQVLDLLREQVLPARDDHLVVAALHEQTPRVVDAADVAGGHQPVDHVLGAAAGVALEQHLVAHEDAARAARRHLDAPLVVELEHGSARRPAGGAGGGAHVRGRGDRGPGHLGGAVEVVERVAELVHPLGGQVAGQRGAAGGHHGERRGVVAAAHLGRQLQDPLHHHRHHHQRVRARALDRGQAVLGIELAGDAPAWSPAASPG